MLWMLADEMVYWSMTVKICMIVCAMEQVYKAIGLGKGHCQAFMIKKTFLDRDRKHLYG